MAKDYYGILGLKRDASQKEIKQAYRRLARKHHPDVNPGDRAAEERFKEVNRAFEVLSDAEKRAKYDRFGEQWEQAEAFEKARAAAGQTGRSQTFHFDLGDILRGQGGGGGFEDILGNLFGGGARRRGPMRGQNIEYAAEITLEEAYAGTTRTLQLQSEEPCVTCGGSGQIAGAVCHVCQGHGTLARPKRIEVRIPAGARDGTRVRLAGEGSPGAGGGPRGDLYVAIRVRPHPRFERRGDDLQVTLSVPLTTAVLGGEAQVPTLDGLVGIKVPAGSPAGRVFRLRGQGLPNLQAGGGRGDLLAALHVELPGSLTARERELFEELRKLGR
jgi:molecular chaperone DnaJ